MKTTTAILFIVVALFGVFAILTFIGSSGIMGVAAIASLLCGLFALILSRIIERVNPKVWMITGLVVLAILFIRTSSIVLNQTVAMWVLIPLGLINAGFLFYSGLSLSSTEPRARTFSLLLGVLLILKTFFTLYDLTIWDSTYDSLDYFALFFPIFAVLLSGLTLLIALPPRTKWAGVMYLLLLPILMISVSTLAQRVDFRALTNQRADRIVQAIESFYAREGRYPESLSDLTPRFMLALPEPVIIYGQNWCYESGDGYYRLGYVDREHWSDPRLIGRIYKAEGQTSEQSLMCEAEITAIQQSNPDYPYSYWMESQ